MGLLLKLSIKLLNEIGHMKYVRCMRVLILTSHLRHHPAPGTPEPFLLCPSLHE